MTSNSLREDIEIAIAEANACLPIRMAHCERAEKLADAALAVVAEWMVSDEIGNIIAARLFDGEHLVSPIRLQEALRAVARKMGE